MDPTLVLGTSKHDLWAPKKVLEANNHGSRFSILVIKHSVQPCRQGNKYSKQANNQASTALKRASKHSKHVRNQTIKQAYKHSEPCLRANAASVYGKQAKQASTAKTYVYSDIRYMYLQCLLYIHTHLESSR